MAPALTCTAPDIQLELVSTCAVFRAWDPERSDPRPPRFAYHAIWDTGATLSAISERVVQECRPRRIMEAAVQGVHGTAYLPIHLITLELSNGVLIPEIRVIAGDIGDADVLIGMDVITLGDFAVTNADGFTQFSFRTPSQEHIDFVAEIDQGGRPSDPPTP